ncbi:MAG: GlmU family protein [Flavobacteriaceae bacterium]|nr:GlmU family protein [Flavobacteriaceae bacterium]
MQIIFSDAQYWKSFLPLTYTRPVAEIRCGILTFAERWQKLLQSPQIFYLTEDYLQGKFKLCDYGLSLIITPNFLPTENILAQILDLKEGEALVYRDEVIVAKIDVAQPPISQINKMIDVEGEILLVEKPTDIFTYNEQFLNFDFDLLTKGRKPQELSPTNNFLGSKENLFIEEGAEVEFATLNCKTGKIYIGKNAEIMEGAMIRGALALCEGSKINMGAKVYGATTIGPYSKIGGEVNNIVVFGYSNKGHEGFVGNSVIGEWCNLGADTNSSNLKNNYANVKLWDYQYSKFVDTGLQFCGLIMGDHSKSAINTQFNTGTVVGVAANIFKQGFPPNLIKSFSWGGMKDDEKYLLNKIFEVMEKVMQRREKNLTEEDREIMKHLYDTAI